MKRVALAVVSLFCAVVVSAGDAPDVKLLRLPEGGVQPQVVVDAAGIVHAVSEGRSQKRGRLLHSFLELRQELLRTVARE